MIDPPAAHRIRVLVADDSALVRLMLRHLLEQAGDIEVVDTASSGLEAIEKVRTLKPDVLTLDIEMSGIDGIETTRRLMATNPLPILVISSISTEGAEATFRALDAGAADFVPKGVSRDQHGVGDIAVGLIEKVRALAKRPSARPPAAAPSAPAAAPDRVLKGPFQSVAIAASTGGPSAVETLLGGLPRSFPFPLLIVQHMPPYFLELFVKRLAKCSPLDVNLARDGETVGPGTVRVGPGGLDLCVAGSGSKIHLRLAERQGGSSHKPSADALFSTLADVCGPGVLGVVMTGMGQDGLEGARRLHAAGGRLIAQSERSCVVYGMPRAIVDAGIADLVCDLDQLAPALCTAAGV